MSTLAAVATVAVTVVVVLGPGLLWCHLLGVRGFPAWALAPVLSCSVIGLEGVGAELVGLRWSVGLYVALTAVVAAVAFIAGRPLHGRRAQPDPRPVTAAAWVGVALGAATVLAGFAVSMGSIRA